MKPRRLAAWAALAAVLLAGCGQTGDLYLPDEGIKTPVEIRSAPTTTRSPTGTAPPAGSAAAGAVPPAPTPPAEEEPADKPPRPQSRP